MKKIASIIICLLLLQANTAYANGGPVAWTELSPFNSLSVKSVHASSISLTREDLNITITGLNTYHVKAKYILKNTGESQDVIYGVPITGDLVKDEESDWGDRAGFETIMECIAYAERTGYKWSRSTCQEYVNDAKRHSVKYRAKLRQQISKIPHSIKISHDNKKVSCSVLDVAPFADKRAAHEYTLLNKTKGWCVTEPIRFKRNNETSIVLEYSAFMEYEDELYSKSPLTEFSDRKLTYYFSPAGYWEGNVSKVNIVLDLGPYKSFAKIVSPSGYKKNMNNVVWSLNDVDFSKMSKLDVVLPSNIVSSYALGEWNKTAPEYLRIPLKAKASSTLESNRGITYESDNVTDGRMDTAWCEGVEGAGEGQWIEVIQSSKKFENYCDLHGIVITPGYLKNQKTYLNNARIKKVRVSSCDNTIEHDFDISLPEYFITSPYLISNAILDFIKTSECFKVTILEVEKGIFEDSCISEIAVVMHCG